MLGAVLSHPLPVKSLGSPLHYQLADRTQAPPEAINLYSVEYIVYYLGFLRVIHNFRADSYVLLTRLPRA